MRALCSTLFIILALVYSTYATCSQKRLQNLEAALQNVREARTAALQGVSDPRTTKVTMTAV